MVAATEHVMQLIKAKTLMSEVARPGRCAGDDETCARAAPHAGHRQLSPPEYYSEVHPHNTVISHNNIITLS